MSENKKKKLNKNKEEWMKELYLTNLVTVIIEVLAYALIYFIIVGPLESKLNIGVMSVGFIFLIPYISIGVIDDIINGSRRDLCIKGKWSLKGGDISDDKQLKSVWKRTGLEASLLGFSVAIVLWLIIFLIGIDSFDPFSSILIVFIVTLIITMVLIKRHLPKELVSCWITFTEKKATLKPFRKYFFVTYAFPWTLLLIYLISILGLRGYYDTVIAEGGVDMITLFIELLITGWVVEIFLWTVGRSHILTDIHLGKVEKGGKKLSQNKLILFLILIPLILVSIVLLVLLIMGIDYFLSPYESIIIDVVVAVITGLIGLYLGAWWAKTK